MADGSISVNPTVANIDINNATTDWLWAAFAVMFLSDLVFIYWSYTKPIGMRTFYQLPVLILSTASIAYFSMASDLGATPIVAEFPRGAAAGSTRSIWYVRYIDWTITTPLLLLELLLATGLPLSEILIIIFMDLVMIVAGLVGALVQSRYKWGYYAFGCAAQFFIWWGTLVKAPQATTAMGNDVRRSYTASAYALALIWLLYPIAWAVADGGNVISPLKEMIFYGILDLVAKPVFCFYHAYQISKVPYERFLLSSGKASTGAGGVLPGTFVNGQSGNGQVVEPNPAVPMAHASNGNVNYNLNSVGGIGGITGVRGDSEGASYGIGNGMATAPGSLNAREGMARRVSGRGAAEAQ